MARIGRIVLPGIPHHITQRGVRSMDIFHCDSEREEYLGLLREQGQRFGLTFVAYCLMSNHVHLIVVPHEADSLARGIGEAHRLYTRAINFSQGVRGYLFQGRFYSCALDERHLVAAIRYVLRNPVRAGMVKQAREYRWSSAAFHMGLRETDLLVEKIDEFGLELEWAEMLRTDPEEIPTLREKARTGRPCGDDEFVRRAEQITGRLLCPRPPGRPRKENK